MATIEEQPERTLESRLRFSRDMMAGPIYRKYEKAGRDHEVTGIVYDDPVSSLRPQRRP